jgi:hypothetical protein
VDLVPDQLLLRKSGSAGTSGSVARNSDIFTSAVYIYIHTHFTNYIVSFRVVCQLSVLLVVSEHVNMQCSFSPSYVTFFFSPKNI